MANIASKSYGTGDVIFECKPLIYCLEIEFKSFNCDNCLQRNYSLKKCSKCYQMWYCDRDCQQNDWKFHKHECKVYCLSSFDMNSTRIYYRLLIRLWFWVKSSPRFLTKRHQLMNGQTISLRDVQKENGLQKMINGLSMVIIDQFCKLVKPLNLIINSKELISCVTLVSCTRHLYSFKLYGHSNEEIELFSLIPTVAIGIVLQKPYMSHSCLPNTCIVTKGLKLEVRAMKSIDLGEPLTTAITDLAKDKTERHNCLLKQMYLPVCECDRCEQELDIDMDYQEFEKLKEEEHHNWKLNSSGNYVTDYTINYDLILYYQYIYGQNNTYLSEALVHSFANFSLYSEFATKSLVKLWYKEIEATVLITHGSDHSLYKLFHKLYLKAISD